MSGAIDRGREAQSPFEIPKTGWRDILWRVKDEIADDNIAVVSAGVAFFGLLALFPAIAVLISIAGLLIDPATVEAQLREMVAVLPEDAAAILKNQAREVAAGSDASIGLAAVLGILLALYGASKGMKTLMQGMNIAYDETEKRNLVQKNLVALGLTACLVVGVVIAIGFTVVTPVVLEIIGLSGTADALVTYGRWPVMAVLTILGLAVIYRYAPSRENAKWQWVSPGALVAAIIWIIGSIGFAAYARNFGSYNETYGALGGVIILLTWLWLSAFVILLGAELNAEMEHQTRRDTTTGEPRPMRERGAVKADTLGETP